MAGKIYHIQSDESLQALDEQAYASEDLLQRLLEHYPDLLAGDQIDPDKPRRWLLVDREVGVPDANNAGDRWSLDHLFLDQDGIPTLVEVKRSSDTRTRREVVAQMLDYAANAVVHWPADAIRTKFEVACEARGHDPNVLVADFVEMSENGEPDVDSYWSQVKTNLQAGKVRMVFVADLIPVELRRIVEFLNEQMDPAQVLAIELRQYVGGGIRTLVPRVLGLTATSQQRKSVSGGNVLYTQFWEQLLERARQRTQLHAHISPGKVHWVSASAGKAGISYAYSILRQGARIELYIAKGDAEQNKAVFDQLAQSRQEIEETFGDPLQWRRFDNKRTSSIAYSITDGGLAQQDTWPYLQDRMISAMVRLHAALQPHISKLKV